jgi:hypothetical protein
MQVLQKETDADAQETARQAISTLVLQLLQHLTGLWQPPALCTLAMQLLSGTGSAQLMPSSESVAPPTPVLAARDARQSKGRAAHTESDAEAAVLDLLRILQAAGVGSWQQLQSMQGPAQGGAGLAALYSACSHEDGVLAFPQDAVTAIQVCCAAVGPQVQQTLASTADSRGALDMCCAAHPAMNLVASAVWLEGVCAHAQDDLALPHCLLPTACLTRPGKVRRACTAGL